MEMKSIIPKMEVESNGGAGSDSVTTCNTNDGNHNCGSCDGNCSDGGVYNGDNKQEQPLEAKTLREPSRCDLCSDGNLCHGHCIHMGDVEDSWHRGASALTPDDIELQIYRNRSVMEANIILKSTGEVIERIPVQWKSRNNQLDYLSVSKMHAYEECPACFYKQYMSDEGIEEDSGNFYTKFGSILHGTVEKVQNIFNETGLAVDPTMVYNEVWAAHDLTDNGDNPTDGSAYLEGIKLIRDYFARNPVNARQDIAKFVEYEWRGQLGGGEFGLQIDYAGVYKNNPLVGILKDYKTNRMPFTPAELEDSLQLRIYMLVLMRFLAPEVKEWQAGYEMFRFGFQMCPRWTEQDLLDAENYVQCIRKQIESDNVWEEHLNNYCGFRKCRMTCKTYRDYIEDPKRYIEMVNSDTMSLEQIEKERQLMAKYEKVASSRKKDCENILKAQIENAMQQGKKLVIDGQELYLFAQAKGSYRYNDTRNVLLVNNKLDLLDNCLSITKTKLDAAISSDPSLKLALAGCMDTNYTSPYIMTKKSK